MASKNSREFDGSYFENYCSAGSYDKLYKDYSDIDSCIALLKKEKLKPKSILVLGAATGRVLERFDRSFKVKPVGCEISDWAYQRIPRAYRSRIACEDMCSYVPRLLSKRVEIDLTFTNSLFYLPKAELKEILRPLAELTQYLHFCPLAEGDAWVRINEPYCWWQELFADFGFFRTRSPYLWNNYGLD